MSARGVHAIKAMARQIAEDQDKGSWDSHAAIRLIAAAFQGDTLVGPDEAKILNKYRTGYFESGARQLFNIVLRAEEHHSDISDSALEQALSMLDKHDATDRRAITQLSAGAFDRVLDDTDQDELAAFLKPQRRPPPPRKVPDTVTCDDLNDCFSSPPPPHHHPQPLRKVTATVACDDLSDCFDDAPPPPPRDPATKTCDDLNDCFNDPRSLRHVRRDTVNL